MNTDKVKKFWISIQHRASSFRLKDCALVVEDVQTLVSVVDSRIVVECNRNVDGILQITFTGGGIPEVMNSVLELKKAVPRIANVELSFLKDPQGFEFEIDLQGLKLEVSKIAFEPMRCDQRPDSLGVQLFVPAADHPEMDWNSIVNLILATGLGERQMQFLSHVEVVDDSEIPENALHLADLEAYIEWFNARSTLAFRTNSSAAGADS